MLANDWQPTAHLRYAVSGQIQQLWQRECRETRKYNGIPRWCTWTEQQWRDIPSEQPTPETPAVPDDRWIKHSEETRCDHPITETVTTAVRGEWLCRKCGARHTPTVSRAGLRTGADQ